MNSFHRSIFLLFLCIALPLAPVHADEKGAAAEKFVANLGESALALVTDKAVVGEARREKFRMLLNEHFDLNWIGQFVLGRNWRRASPEQREVYLKLFEESIVFTYTNQFDSYSGQMFEVTGSGENGRYTVVKSKIVDPASAQGNVLIDWRLIEDDGKFWIVDVVIEGISMGITQRNEYSSVIESNGGKIDPLLARMEEILEGLRKRT
ncbi:MlaC/ttg2D family ABC transporter substrate-binding protein [Nisaea nitritireducens]|uniref:MlaC/ttg2D family ABC transporter substrate-binding protein n=1 Tax=Nisaea nitritireducens TaxID=568392 RepID=UPI001867F743|nr:ABC transporter substrate-binding protein [Nisaea nitritireducens]